MSGIRGCVAVGLCLCGLAAGAAGNGTITERRVRWLEKAEAAKPEQKRKPGRPKGSKKGVKKARADEPKRSPGRPKGSKNKKTLIREAELAKREKRMKRKNDSG